MRLTEFHDLMTAHFGAVRAPSLARDHVFTELAGRTANEALAVGEDPKRVWSAVCRAFDVPEPYWYGLPDDDPIE